MNDVPFAKRRVLPAQKTRVVLIDEERKVWTEFAAFVAQTFGEGRMRVNETGQGLADGGRVEGHIAGAPRETAIGAVKQHPHMRTTNGLPFFRHASTLARARISR